MFIHTNLLLPCNPLKVSNMISIISKVELFLKLSRDEIVSNKKLIPITRKILVTIFNLSKTKDYYYIIIHYKNRYLSLSVLKIVHFLRFSM